MKNRSLSALYTNYTLFSFAWSLVGIFVPIYLLKLGYSLEEVLIFCGFYAAAIFIFSCLAGFWAGRIGLKKIMILNFSAAAVYLALLATIKYFAFPLWIIACAGGFYMAFYWFPLNVFFVQHSEERAMGKNYGKLNAYPQIVGWIAPLLGGWLAASFSQGFVILFVVAGAVFFLSLMPIIGMEDIFPKVRLRIMPLFEFIRRYPKYVFIESVHYYQYNSEQMIWPIFVFLAFNSIFSIGVVGAALAVGSYFMMLFSGIRSDNGQRKNMLLWGAGVMAAIWILRAVTHDQLFFYALTAAAGFFGALIQIPFNSFAFNLAKQGTYDEFILFRELPVFIGRAAAVAAAFIFIQNLQLAFFPLAISQLVFLIF